ncbi:molybdenum hydroxylase [Spirochaetia bacterium]|nr:molybdenum hydroxylase [Spirochaetia bacterium]
MLVIIKGAGDLASGIALRLFHAGFDIAMTEIAAPLAVRRTVSFSQAVYDGKARVEDISAILVKDEVEMQKVIDQKQIAIFIDPLAAIVRQLKPPVLIDAIMAKKNTGTAIDDAPLVVGIGPGFTAGSDCHAVVETQRGHTLGRLIIEGSAIPNTGIPGSINGYTTERLLRSSADGIFEPLVEIGDTVQKDDTVARVRDSGGNVFPVIAAAGGIVRGLLPPGITVKKGMKAGDLDPRCVRSHCFTVSDKALSIGGGVLEALLRFSSKKCCK